jgi:hypothetical protein
MGRCTASYRIPTQWAEGGGTVHAVGNGSAVL